MRASPAFSCRLAACSGGGGSWPSLARRPIEGPAPATAAVRRCAAAIAPTCGPAVAAVAPAAPAVASPAVASPVVASGRDDIPAVSIADVTGQLAVAGRDLDDAATRLGSQREAAARAVLAARGTAEGSEAWARAETETTALDRIGNQIGDIRGRLDGIAGTLAAASATGTDVAAPLAADRPADRPRDGAAERIRGGRPTLAEHRAAHGAGYGVGGERAEQRQRHRIDARRSARSTKRTACRRRTACGSAGWRGRDRRAPSSPRAAPGPGSAARRSR